MIKAAIHETVDADHGKFEIRKYWTTSHIDWLQGKEDGSKLQTICMVERQRQFDEKTESETSYYNFSFVLFASFVVIYKHAFWATFYESINFQMRVPCSFPAILL
jgi:hypothetical protein